VEHALNVLVLLEGVDAFEHLGRLVLYMGVVKAPVCNKSGSDNTGLFPLYGTTSGRCQGGDDEGWFREPGLSEPSAVRKSVGLSTYGPYRTDGEITPHLLYPIER
jgi:hypothetical protein